MNGIQLHVSFQNSMVGITSDMDTAQRTAAIKTWLTAHPQEVWFKLATPTTTTISPALDMTYRVQAGGSESIVVPDGEISAAPILTIAEPVNMSTELARIWAAIAALQASRSAAVSSTKVDISENESTEAPTMDEKKVTEKESDA